MSSTAPIISERQEAEQIAVLQRFEEHREQLSDLAEIGLGPITGLIGRRQQQQEPADERTDQRKHQIAFHQVSSSFAAVIAATREP
ncbi:hypothetical protein ACVWZR_005622 [Bradyrhizobium sp. i1.3.1]